MLKPEGPMQALSWATVYQSEGSKLPALCHLCRHQQLLPSPALHSALCLSLLYPHSWSRPPVSTVPALLWSLATLQAGPTGSLGIYEGADCGGPATSSIPDCF